MILVAFAGHPPSTPVRHTHPRTHHLGPGDFSATGWRWNICHAPAGLALHSLGARGPARREGLGAPAQDPRGWAGPCLPLGPDPQPSLCSEC